MTENPLVDQNAKFEWGDYIPGVESTDQGGTSKWNPFTPGQGHTTGKNTWFKGLPLVDAALAMREDIKNDDVFAAILDTSAGSLEYVGMAVALGNLDWGGLVVAPAMSWLMEHVKPLRLILDELTGNMDTVLGVAQTWNNLGAATLDAASAYGESVQRTIACWMGDAAEAYRHKRAHRLLEALTVAGILSNAWGDVVRIVGECVGITHDIVRDLIAALQGQIVQDLVEMATVVGAVAIPQQTMGEIARVTTMVADSVDEVMRAQLHAIELLKKLVTLLGEALTVVRRFQESS